MRLSYAIFALSVVLTGCSSASITPNDSGRLSPEEIEYHEQLGSAGYGWAYTVLSNDEQTSGNGTSSDVWDARALHLGGSQSSLDYSERIVAEASRLPRGDSFRDIMLKEAEKYNEIAVRNAFMYPDSIGDEYGREMLARAKINLDEIEKLK